ncbi:ATP-binding cassette domain-containing protein [Lacticaseibacillus mingshuiensis]|uniref:ATP-binding cassette domain-containing protein n=1 Tax=Lacticaseibacillus mingshuiensis TaxID=2799574 RepID=UPI00194EECC2|nr:ATP-binding cassette domain-containing protein [Lacticaseibacillus mingshuiensis]
MELTVDHLGLAIAGKNVLQDVSFRWQQGQVLGLVGRNGVGKTTLMRTLTDQYRAQQGGVFLGDAALCHHPALRQQLLYIDPANLFFKHNTLAQISRYFAETYEQFDAGRFARLAADHDLPMGKQYGELSKGYQALVVMALDLASNVPFVCLDEPFDGLDLFIREAIVKNVIAAVANEDRSFLIASHDLRELDGLADRVLFLRNGTISHDYDLESLREKAMKLQLVFKDAEIPQVVRVHGQILNVRGRVLEVLFKDYDPVVEAAVKAAETVLAAPLPLELSDLFRSEYQDNEGERVYG